MNKQQLVDAVGERIGDRKTAAAAVEAVLDTVTGALAEGERVALFGFGVFEKVDRAARTARNPATGGTVEVPATSVPRFRAGQALKDAVNGTSLRAGTAPSRARTAVVSDTVAPPAKDKADKKSSKQGKAAKDKKDKGKKGKK